MIESGMTSLAGLVSVAGRIHDGGCQSGYRIADLKDMANGPHPDSSPLAPARPILLRGALVAAIGALALLAASTPSASAGSYTIRTHNGGWISRIGPMRITGPAGGTLGRAISAFGAPSRTKHAPRSSACHVRWKRLKLKGLFANYGGRSPCSRSGGKLQSATTRSPRFRTSRGVRVGSASETIPGKHHNAEFVDGAWWIASVQLPFGEGDEMATIKAIVAGGRVRALSLWVGAAGE